MQLCMLYKYFSIAVRKASKLVGRLSHRKPCPILVDPPWDPGLDHCMWVHPLHGWSSEEQAKHLKGGLVCENNFYIIPKDEDCKGP